MEDLRTILSSHQTKIDKTKEDAAREPTEISGASFSEIPDLFFDEVLIQFKLSRVEIALIMYLYRITWCRPNLHRKHGIAPMVSHAQLAAFLELETNDLHSHIRNLEAFGFIETIRSGQYFVRKYF